MEQETELLDSQNEQDSTEVEESVSDTQSEETSNDEVAVLKQQNKELFARAKRAEGFVLEDGQWVKKQKQTPKQEKETPKNEVGNLSLKDIRALQDVADEDVDEVTEFARFKGISIAEAKKSPVIQTLLKTKAEERASAQAAATTSTRKSTRTNTTEALISKVYKQEDLSAEEMQSAAKAMVASLRTK